MWKNEKFSPTGKIFREINSLATSLVKRYFHEIFSKKVWEKIIAISTLWDVSCNLCEKLMKNISWNQLLLSSITSWKTLISRKFWKIRFGKSKIAKCHKCILTYILYRHIHYSLIFIPSSPNSSFFPMRKKKNFPRLTRADISTWQKSFVGKIKNVNFEIVFRLASSLKRK